MSKITVEFKEAVLSLPVNNLQDAILKYCRKDQAFYDFINLRYLKNKEAEEELFEKTSAFIRNYIYFPGGRGVIQRRLKSGMDKCIKQINHYAIMSANKKREADLLLLLIDSTLEAYTDELGTCFTTFDSKLALTTKRLLSLVTKKLHPDYFIEYEDELNRFLRILHARSSHLDIVYHMPQRAEDVKL